MGEGLLKSVKASRRGLEISHLLFADDCILFGKETNRRAIVLKEILKEYERCLCQCVNFEKSTIFYSSNSTGVIKGRNFRVARSKSFNKFGDVLGVS